MNKPIPPTPWQRLPVIVRSVIAGAIMATLGVLPWSVLASLNLKYGNAVPWATIPAAVYLWIYWRFAKGKGWPRSISAIRQKLCRANDLSGEVWGAAIIAGILGLVAMLLFQGIFSRMVQLPQQSTQGLASVPLFTMIISVIMGAVVAGVVEETSFRGYMQGPIERRYGPVIAILITGTLFGLAHFTHAEVTFALLPFYLLVAATYGTIAYLTNSILPGIALHAGGNILGALMLLGAGRSEWQVTTTEKQLIWETGTDASFWMTCIGFLIVTAAAIWAFRALATVAKQKHNLNGDQLQEH